MTETHAGANDHLAPQLRQVLAHLPDAFNSIAWSPDGRQLASGAGDGTVRVWDIMSGTELRVYASASPVYYMLMVAFQEPTPTVDVLGTTPLGDPDVIIRTLAWDADAAAVTRVSQQYVSAKIVLVGESNVGKSCLALRLAQDRYEEQGTTHGMRLWPMRPEALSPTMAAPVAEQREVVLWDLGGQREYRLVHQLFLHDTTLALILLDPTRDSAFDDVMEWNVRLDTQLRGQAAVKLLIGTKADQIRPS